MSDKLPQNPKPNTNYQRPILFSLMGLILLFGGSLAWASYAKIAGAIIASGSVAVEGKPKSIQHLDGGIVQKIYVNSGAKVSAGAVLLELDDTSVQANLAIYNSRLKDALLKQARLQAELAQKDAVIVPRERSEQLGLGDLSEALAQQIELMNARRLTREARYAQLDEKVSQYGHQIEGLNNLIKEKKTQIRLLEDEKNKIAKLVDKKLVVETRLSSLQRNLADMRGQIAEHGAEIARVNNSITETRLARLQVDREFREEAITELEQTDSRIGELLQQVLATQEQLKRVIIRSPVDGIVHELNMFTIGGVVQPGQTLMQVIPQSGKFDFELSVDVRSVDQLYSGQSTIIRLPAFHAKTTPELKGQLVSVSPTSVVDEKSGVSFYRVQISLEEGELDRLGNKELVPGMPVEGFITTQERTVLSYLLKPLADNLEHVFREE